MPTTYPITNGRKVFTPTLYTGNGTSQSIVNNALGSVGFKPDLVWMKSRSNSYSNALVDSVRGSSSILYTDQTYSAAISSAGQDLTSFNSNGFSVGIPTNANSTNANGSSIVAWQWQAGQGTNTTNTTGSITSTVSVNQTAGFSIVQYTGTGATGGTVGHGLGSAPGFIVVKDQSVNGYGWLCYHSSLGVNQYIQMNGTGGAAALVGTWGTAVNSTTFGVFAQAGSSNNATGDSLIAYCWAPVPGYSQFGNYTGNGLTNGPFIYTGFRPAYILLKKSSNVGDWYIYDSTRTPNNVVQTATLANSANPEGTTSAISISMLSNGFQIQTADGAFNQSGGTYIYATFAECPFKYANSR